MKRKQVETRKKRKKLQKLYRLLTYESSTIYLLAAIPFVGMAIMMVILSTVNIIFVPFMIKTLYQVRKLGWLTTFLLITLVPLTLAIIFKGNLIAYTIFSSFEMLNFFAYCWIFKFVVKDWLDEFAEDDFEAEHEFEFNESGY